MPTLKRHNVISCFTKGLFWIRNFFGKIRRKPKNINSNVYKSNVLLGIVFKANPFSVEIGVDQFGVYLTTKYWHGLKVKKEFYPLDMVLMVTISEIIGKIGRIKMLVRVSANENVVIEIPRFFSVNSCRLFFQNWILVSQRQKYST